MEALWRRCIVRGTKSLDRSFPSLLEYFSHQNLGTQTASMSAAATKSKSKSKTAAPTKKAKSSKGKKTTRTAKAPSGGSEESRRLEALTKACLDAPTPIRYLKEKDRLREMEREKLGLISKDRQREIDLEKAKKKMAKDEKPIAVNKDELNAVTLGLIEENEVPTFELTEEEGKRLAKEYSRVLMKELRERQAGESARLTLKNEAIAALPPRLREAAMVPDLTPFPSNRYRATLTPPIEGYAQRLKEAAQQLSLSKRKRR
eukprot:Gb_02780 [translate_table: standard]